MGIFVNDTFSGEAAGTPLGSHVGEVGATWTVHPAYANNGLKIDANGDIYNDAATDESAYYASGTPPSAEYNVEFIFRSRSDIGDGLYVGGRSNTSSPLDGYFILVEQNINPTQYSLYRVSAGVWTQIGSSYVATPNTDQDYTVRLEIKNATKKVFIDGVERITSNDNTITAAGSILVGQYTIGAAQSVSAGLHTRSVRAYTLFQSAWGQASNALA